MPKFNVGDRVRVVDEPNYDCDFGWDDDPRTGMTQYCGMEATVVSVCKGRYGSWDEYTIDIDGQRFAWCQNCFTAAEDADIVESDMDVAFLLGGGRT